MEGLRNLMRLEAQRVMQAHSRTRVGVVSSYDPKTHMVKVTLQPEENESGWIPIATEHVGNGFGVLFGPEIGDQLEIGFQEHDSETPRVLGRYHSDVDKPPEVKAGEMLMKHKSGSSIFFDKDGNVHIKSHGNLYINGTGSTP